jgi:hypothetical protein
MPRAPIGSPIWAGDHWKIRITLRDGTRPWVHLDPGITEQEARELSPLIAARSREINGVWRPGDDYAAASAAPNEETVREWSERWSRSRKAQGLRSCSSDESRLRTHVLPVWGDRPMSSITRDDIEIFVEQLDEDWRASKFSWHTARLV